jgi:hypothetical protein
MTLRVPLGGDQTLQTEFHEIERRLRRLEKITIGIGGQRPGSTISVINSGGPGVNLTPIIERIEALELAIQGAEDEFNLDNIPTLGPVGPSSVRGLAPDPGLRPAPTGLASHVLHEDAEWSYPYRGLIRVGTSGEHTDPPHDVLNLHGALHAQGASLGNVECYDLHTHGDVEYGDGFWDDLRVGLSAARVGASTYLPTWTQIATDGAGSRGVYAYGFSAVNDNEAFFEVQLPHDRKTGSDLEAHVHWCPNGTDTGSVSWNLEYTVANIDGTFGNTASLTGTDSGDGTAFKHQLCELGTIDGSSLTLSAVLICRLWRDVSADDLSDLACAVSVDFHYQRDSPGSTEEYTK